MTSRALVRDGVSPRNAVAQYFRMWNDGDLALLPALISPSWVDHAHPERQCPTDVGQAITSTRKADPNFRISIDAMLGDSDVVTVNGRIQTSSGVENWVWLVRVEDGRLQEMWTYSAD